MPFREESFNSQKMDTASFKKKVDSKKKNRRAKNNLQNQLTNLRTLSKNQFENNCKYRSIKIKNKLYANKEEQKRRAMQQKK
ncbi:MAG: hypothetical protein HS129_11345 [Leptospiraceae bacterium]|nr:hypothetical protein [Leptospiraceae bacterium]